MMAKAKQRKIKKGLRKKKDILAVSPIFGIAKSNASEDELVDVFIDGNESIDAFHEAGKEIIVGQALYFEESAETGKAVVVPALPSATSVSGKIERGSKKGEMRVSQDFVSEIGQLICTEHLPKGTRVVDIALDESGNFVFKLENKSGGIPSYFAVRWGALPHIRHRRELAHEDQWKRTKKMIKAVEKIKVEIEEVESL